MFVPSLPCLIIGYPGKYVIHGYIFIIPCSIFLISSYTIILGQFAIISIMVVYEIYRIVLIYLASVYYGEALKTQLRGQRYVFHQILIIIPAILFELLGQLYVSAAIAIAKHQFYKVGKIYTAVGVVWAVKTLSSFLVVIFTIAMVQGFWSIVWMVALFLVTFLGCWFQCYCVQMNSLDRLDYSSLYER